MTLQELLDTCLTPLGKLERTSGFDLIPAVNATTEILFEQLQRVDSDLVKKDLNLAYGAGVQDATLPQQFRGLAEKPYLAATGRELDQLKTADRSYYQIQGAGVPQKYEIEGRKMLLYPTPAALTTVLGKYYRLPEAAVALSDDLPWDGQFDLTYQAGVLKIAEVGLEIVTDPQFALFLAGKMEAVKARSPRTRRATAHYF